MRVPLKEPKFENFTPFDSAQGGIFSLIVVCQTFQETAVLSPQTLFVTKMLKVCIQCSACQKLSPQTARVICLPHSQRQTRYRPMKSYELQPVLKLFWISAALHFSHRLQFSSPWLKLQSVLQFAHCNLRRVHERTNLSVKWEKSLSGKLALVRDRSHVGFSAPLSMRGRCVRPNFTNISCSLSEINFRKLHVFDMD